jgi:hypothetical protein
MDVSKPIEYIVDGIKNKIYTKIEPLSTNYTYSSSVKEKNQLK